MPQAPQSAYRSFIGVAKDTVNANLTGPIAVGATSLPITNTVGTSGTLTSAGSTYSAVIVDGPNGETVACTGNLTSGAIACAATANVHPANVYVYFQLTASIGPTAYIRPTKIDFSDAYAQLYDKGYRGSQAEEYGAQAGMRVANFSMDGDLFADDFGYLCGAFFGAYDYVATQSAIAITAASLSGSTVTATATPSAGSWLAGQTVTIASAAGTNSWANINGTWTVLTGGATSFTFVPTLPPTSTSGYTASSGLITSPTAYAFSPQNTGNGQPNSYLFYDYNPGANTCYVMAKAVLSDLTVKFDPGALVGWTGTGKAFAMSAVATPTPSFSTFTPVASRVGASTINGSYTGDVENCEFAFKRNEFGEVNTIQGIQDPLAIFSGPVGLQTKFSLVQADNSQYLNYVNETQPTFDVKAVKGTGTTANGIEIHCNAANYENIKIVQTGKAYVTLDGGFTALANTTDASAAGGGYAPARVTLSVGTNTGATQY